MWKSRQHPWVNRDGGTLLNCTLKTFCSLLYALCLFLKALLFQNTPLIWGQFRLNQKQIKVGFLPCLKPEREQETPPQRFMPAPALRGHSSSRGHLLPPITSPFPGLPQHMPTALRLSLCSLSLRHPQPRLHPRPDTTSARHGRWHRTGQKTHHLARFFLRLGQVTPGQPCTVPHAAGEN